VVSKYSEDCGKQGNGENVDNYCMLGLFFLGGMNVFVR
jgi:hypothetical protein